MRLITSAIIYRAVLYVIIRLKKRKWTHFTWDTFINSKKVKINNMEFLSAGSIAPPHKIITEIRGENITIKWIRTWQQIRILSLQKPPSSILMAEKPKDAKISAPAAALTSAQLDTSKADRRVWMMKCPPVVARAMQSNSAHHQPPPLFPSDPSAGQIFAKVVVAVDPLHPNDDLSSTQVYMCVRIYTEMCEYVSTCVALCFSIRFLKLSALPSFNCLFARFDLQLQCTEFRELKLVVFFRV